jgi:hypothetical protein
MVAAVTPPTSTSIPFIGAFFALQMVLLGSSVIITILVINVSFRSPKTHKMSPFLRLVFLEWVPYLTLMNRPGKKFFKPKSKSKSSRLVFSLSNADVNLLIKAVKRTTELKYKLRERSTGHSSDHSSTQSGGGASVVKTPCRREPYGGIAHLIKGLFFRVAFKFVLFIL